MKATQKMMDFFQQAEQMLTEERPFNKDRWQDMIKYLRTTHLFKQEEKQNTLPSLLSSMIKNKLKPMKGHHRRNLTT